MSAIGMGCKAPAKAVWGIALAGLVSISGCQCGEGGGKGKGGGEGTRVEKGVEKGDGEEGLRIVVSEREVRVEGLTVGDVKELAKDPEGGEIEELGRALRARVEKGEAEKVLLEVKAKVPAAVARRVAVTAWKAGVEGLVFVLADEGGGRVEVQPPVDGDAPLAVTLARDETRVRGADGKTWTIPNQGPARDLKVLGDVLYARKEDPKLRDRDDVDVVIEPGVSYSELFGAIDAANAGGFDRPRLVASPDR